VARRHDDRQVEAICRRVRSNAGLGVPTPGHNKLQEFAKLLDRKPSITRDTAHGDGVNRILISNETQPTESIAAGVARR